MITGSQIPEIAPFDSFMRKSDSFMRWSDPFMSWPFRLPEKQKARDVVVAGPRFPETGGG